MPVTMERLFKVFFLTLFGVFHVVASFDQVGDSDLVHLLNDEDNVVVLFTKNNCEQCDELEDILKNIQNQLKDEINAVVVKAHNSHMVNLYQPLKEPALVYFRKGTPLLYHGPNNAGDIIQMFSENQEPVVKELSDITFEHLTQAASGATTGDWFLFFYSADCVQCLRLHATWEAVGALNKHRLNVARIDRMGAGVATARRLGVVDSPEFMFLRQGKIYRYQKKEYTVPKLLAFVEKDFMQHKNPEIVLPESNDINTLLSSYIDNITNISYFYLSCLGILLTISILCCIKCLSSTRTTDKHASKKSK